MPPLRVLPWISRCASLALVGIVVWTGVGCRYIGQCRKSSDESIAQTRQLALQGKDAQQHGRWDQAEAIFAAAVVQGPRDERARCGYAEALWQRGARDEAVAHMEEAVKLSGNDPERVVQLGNMHFALGNLDRAGKQADKAIAANRELPLAWVLRGKVLQARGEFAAAQAAFHRALGYQPQFPEAQLALAEVYRQEGRPQRALATLQALEASYPPHGAPVEVLVPQGLALGQLGRHADAARTLARAAERGNPSADLLYELARAQLQAGDATAARLTTLAALDRDPGHARSRQLQAEIASLPATMAATTLR
ncbi:MAG: tetratricopeptide repeat protein [Pirellulaceae bacterium]|nr:tetratricopeptide repeat protein [Pirellulaceae bacterium]